MKCERADAPHRLRPVQERETFFGLQRNGLNARELERLTARHPLALIKGFALADDRERQMRERGQVAARSDRAFFGNDWMNSVLQQRDERFDDEGPRTAVAQSQDVG